MGPIDTGSWKEFRISTLFEIVKGSRLRKADMRPGNIRFIGASALNNGITAHISNNEHLHPGNVLTVCYNGSVGSCFYQDEPFWASDDVNVLYPRFQMNREIGLFMAPIIKAVGRRYDFIDKWRVEAMTEDLIPLPTANDGNPDWPHMEAVEESAMAVAAERARMLQSSKSPTVSKPSWQHFRIGDLFEVVKGTRLTRADMIPGDTPFIGATRENNGITARIGNTGHIHPAGIMTVAYNGQKATGTAFWQPADFWASDDVNVLYPKFSLTREIALFLIPIFWKVSRPYSYDDKWNMGAMVEDALVLPAMSDGSPDWNLMQKFMEETLSEARKRLELFS